MKQQGFYLVSLIILLMSLSFAISCQMQMRQQHDFENKLLNGVKKVDGLILAVKKYQEITKDEQKLSRISVVTTTDDVVNPQLPMTISDLTKLKIFPDCMVSGSDCSEEKKSPFGGTISIKDSVSGDNTVELWVGLKLLQDRKFSSIKNNLYYKYHRATLKDGYLVIPVKVVNKAENK